MVERTTAARSSLASNPVRVRFDAFELDEADARLLRDGKPLALPPTPFALLCTLVRQPGSLLTKHHYSDKSVPNLSSIVCLIEKNGKRVLLTGDARGDKIREGLDNAGLLVDGR